MKNMNIDFQIGYRTVWGENLQAVLTWETKGGKETSVEVPLSTVNGETWRGSAVAPANAERVNYRYTVWQNGEATREEWAALPHRLELSKGINRIQAIDRWRDRPENSYRYTSAFTEAFVRHTPSAETGEKSQEAGKRLVVHVLAPEVPEDQVLAVLGSHPILGEWKQGQEMRMQLIAPNEWAFCIDIEAVSGTLEYKFLTLDKQSGEQRAWEMRENRTLTVPHVEQKMEVQVEDAPVMLPFAPWRGAGCVIPVFSLRSEHSFGVGDFGDLKRMVDWVAMTGQRALQILPINDTTMSGKWTDSYPYNSISIFALHPIYADLNALPPLADSAMRTTYKAAQEKLNALAQLDYENVMDTKRNYLRRLFRQEWKKVKESKAYKEFFETNEEWLVPYAAFCYLRDLYGTPDFHHWKTLRTYNAASVKKLMKAGSDSAEEMEENFYIQFILHEQLSEVQRYARSKGIVLKGDIPIGISPTSVEAWTEPHYFNLDGQAGAPPDYFSTNGQNWGFPTYNWDAMLADGCKWWRRRFEKMANYFDAYRIDHVLGFFRIWEIPQHSVHGLLGQFSPALPMSPEEIESYGLPWRKETYTQPYITDRIIYRIFGDDTAEVRHLYLESQQNGHYSLKPEYDTQRKVQAAFGNKNDAHSTKIRDGLYHLISNVLFVPDRKLPDMYHPRIDAHMDFLFEDLGDWEKDAFRRIHEHYFYHRHNQFWYDESMKKLPTLVNATRMLVCAEDLGMIPECVGWVMDRLGILTLEIQTMPKQSWQQFANLWENPYRSVSTISTHDMPTMRLWWDEQRETAQQYYNQMLYHEGAAPHPMTGEIAEEIVSRHLESPSMLCLLSLQDWLSIDEKLRYEDPEAERINVPANPRHYWRYRMHLTIEQLMGATALNEKIRGLVKSYGR